MRRVILPLAFALCLVSGIACSSDDDGGPDVTQGPDQTACAAQAALAQSAQTLRGELVTTDAEGARAAANDVDTDIDNLEAAVAELPEGQQGELLPAQISQLNLSLQSALAAETDDLFRTAVQSVSIQIDQTIRLVGSTLGCPPIPGYPTYDDTVPADE